MSQRRLLKILLLGLVPYALAYGGKPAARLGDMTAHGGSIMVGLPTVLIGGMPAARVGDMHVCPMLNPGYPPTPHVGGPIMMGSPMVLIGGMPAARMGDMVTCAGPPDVIMLGCMTVLIGEGGSGSAAGGGAGIASTTSQSFVMQDSLGGQLRLEGGVVTDSMASARVLYGQCETGNCPILGYAMYPGVYSVSLSPSPDGTAQFEFYRDSLRYSYNRQSGTTSLVDRISLGEGFGIAPHGLGESSATLSVAMANDTSQKVVDLAGLMLSNSDSLYLTVAPDCQLQVLNMGSAKQYSLMVNSFENSMFKPETVANISLPSGNLQVISPPWGSMGLYPIKISFDRNLDGILDELMYVSQLTSAQQIANILTFFDQSVSNGTLTGSGSAKSADGRLGALRNMLSSARNLIKAGKSDSARLQLSDAYTRMDGNPDPPEFVAGTAIADLGRLVDNLRMTLSGIMPIIHPPIANRAAQHTETEAVPTEFGLFQNYPNPFNPSTTIRYGLPRNTRVEIEVYNSLGQKVAQLCDGEMEAGYHEVQFDGSKLASGVYFFRLRAGDFVSTIKLLLMK